MMKIENSPRLSYALMGPEDADLLFELDQDPEVLRYINGGKVSSKEDIDTVFVPRMMSYRDEAKGWGLWQVRITSTHEYIGWVLIRPMDFFSADPKWDDLEIGWRFKQSSWGKGYATEAAIAIKDAVVSQHSEIKYFSAIALPNNKASINIMTKMGMHFVKSAIHSGLPAVGDVEVVYYTVHCCADF